MLAMQQDSILPRQIRYNTPSITLRQSGIIREKENSFMKKAGYTFGISTRLDIKKWDYNVIKTWPKCSYT